jgi:hypothetical protein
MKSVVKTITKTLEPSFIAANPNPHSVVGDDQRRLTVTPYTLLFRLTKIVPIPMYVLVPVYLISLLMIVFVLYSVSWNTTIAAGMILTIYSVYYYIPPRRYKSSTQRLSYAYHKQYFAFLATIIGLFAVFIQLAILGFVLIDSYISIVTIHPESFSAIFTPGYLIGSLFVSLIIVKSFMYKSIPQNNATSTIEKKISNSSTSEFLLIFSLLLTPVIIVFSVLLFNDLELVQTGVQYTHDELIVFLTLLLSLYISVLSKS